MNQQSTLTQILAQTDALFNPYRYPGNSGARVLAGILERRAAYPQEGVPLVVRGGGTQRLAGERELQRMASDDLIKLHYRGKRIGCSLTAKGDRISRALTAGYQLWESFPLLQQVETTKSLCGGKTNAGHVLETDLIAKSFADITSADLALIENKALPLLCRGWLDSATDTEGRIGYYLTEAGELALRGGKPRKVKVPEYDHVSGDEYDIMFEAALAERETWQPASPSHVTIPLSAGMWPRQLEDAKDG